MIQKIYIFIVLFSYTIIRVGAFDDIQSNWYKESILGLKEQGIIDGYGDGNFGPENTISRAEVLKIILTASKSDITEPDETCFGDVGLSWQAKYVCSGVENDITKGYTDGSFRPNNDVTILEVLAFSVRAFDIDLALTPTLSQKEREQATEEWYEKYQAFAHEKNIIPKHAYTIDTYASRGEAANIIYRLQQVVEGQNINYNSSACGVSSSLKSGKHTILVNGVEREYLLYIPSSASKNKELGLIVAFHGRTNNNDDVRDYMQLGGGSYGSSRDQRDFIVAYPAGMGDGPYGWHQQENIDFFDVLITEISENLCIDRDKIFSVGHSLGSWMSNKVSCLRGDVIRAMVGVGSDGYYATCTGPVTSLILHHPDDHLVSYQGGLNAYTYKSEQNYCSDEEKNISLGNITGCQQKTDCSLGNTVTFCDSYSTYLNDPHSWPKNGSDEILDFLKGIDG